MTLRVRIARVAGRPIPLRGNDVDTDQIIPGRFLKAVTFDGLGQYAFYDLRFDAAHNALGHVMDEPRYQARGPRVAIVNQNFGCGSSREHAPQALWRWGVKALVGESFADIFFGNCIAIGVPCVVAGEADVAALMAAVEEDPASALVVDVEKLQVSYRGHTYAVSMPPGAQARLLDGTWNATSVLAEEESRTRATAARLPYISGFGRS